MATPVTFQNTWKTGGSGFDFGFDSSGFYTGKVANARGPDKSLVYGLNDEVIGGTTGGGSGGAAPADYNRASSTYGKVIPLSMGRRRDRLVQEKKRELRRKS